MNLSNRKVITSFALTTAPSTLFSNHDRNPTPKAKHMTALERFFGGSPGAVIARLLVLSVIVGIIFSAIGIHPYQLIDSLQRLALRIYNMGFDAVEWLFGYLWLGALVVFPVWIVSRLWKLNFSQNNSDPFEKTGTPPAGRPQSR